MTMTQFLETEVLSPATEFFSESLEGTDRAERRATRRVSSIPAKAILNAFAVAALAVVPMRLDSIASTSARIFVGSVRHSEAAVEVPSLSAQQLRATRLIRAAFERIDPGPDASGEDPDYGL